MGTDSQFGCLSVRVPIRLPCEIRTGGWIGIEPAEDLSTWWGIPQTTAPSRPNYTRIELPRGVAGRLEGTSDTHALRLNVTQGTLSKDQQVAIIYDSVTESLTGTCIGKLPRRISFYLRFVPDLYTFTPTNGGDTKNTICRHFDVADRDDGGILDATCTSEELRSGPDGERSPQFGSPDDPPRVNSVFYFVQGGPYAQEWPTHEACELVSVHEGNGFLCVGTNEHRVGPGTLLLVKPFQPHRTRVEEGSELKGINLSFSPGSLLPEVLCLNDTWAEADAEGTRVAALLVDVLDETHHFLAGAHNCADAYLTLALVELLRLDSRVKRRGSGAPADSSLQQRIDQCTRYIESHYAENLTLETLAEELLVSPSHLSHSFSQQTGTTISAYITSVRMRRAAGLLRDSAGPLRDVASSVGYSDEFYFSKVFKRHFGMPPGTYRRADRD